MSGLRNMSFSHRLIFWLVALLCLDLTSARRGDPNVKQIPVGQSSYSDKVKMRTNSNLNQLRTHSIQTPYLDSDMQSRFWEFGGDTVIRSDKYIRLASDMPSRRGWLFSKIPLTATNWEVEVEFKIDGTGHLHGDGMAMWITKQRGQQGEVFGSVDNFEGLGIFIDTYKNNRPGTTFPYVMAMVGDGKTSYEKGNDGRDTELAGCSARGIRSSPIATKARLTYYAEKSLKMELQYKDLDTWETCFETGPVTIPSLSYLGFSAETGELSDNFDIISVSTRSLYDSKAPGTGANVNTGKPNHSIGYRDRAEKFRVKQKGGGWGWFFLKMLGGIVLIGGCYAGYTAYRIRSRGSRFD